MDAKSVRDALATRSDGLFHVDWVRSRADGLARLTDSAARGVTAVLADLDLPDSSGLDTFAQLHGAAPQIPILIFTDSQHEAVARMARFRITSISTSCVSRAVSASSYIRTMGPMRMCC